MTFEEWWLQTYAGDGGLNLPGALIAAFREVAENAWKASREQEVTNQSVEPCPGS